MPDEPSDEQRMYAAFQHVINVLLPLESDLRERTYATVATFFGYDAPQVGLASPGTGRAAGERSPPDVYIAPHETPSPKDFLLQKQPNTDVERIVCLAYYLTRYRGVLHFTAGDIHELNTEAAQIEFVYAAEAMSRALKNGFLAVPRRMGMSRGMRLLSEQGERYVDALPDQAAARAVLQKPKHPRHQPAQSAAASQGQAE